MLLYLLLRLPAQLGPLGDIVSSLNDVSPSLASNDSLHLSGVTVNALAFTFHIAYQKAACSIFVLMLNGMERFFDPFFLEGSTPYYGAERRIPIRRPYIHGMTKKQDAE